MASHLITFALLNGAGGAVLMWLVSLAVLQARRD